MQQQSLDLVGMGNPMLQSFALRSEGFLEAAGLEKGRMRLVDRETAGMLRAWLAQEGRGACASSASSLEVPAGSVANSIAIAAQLGLRTAFVGKLADDDAGRAFRTDFHRLGIDFATPPLAGHAGGSDKALGTAHCTSIITPDGERTMATYLGAATRLASTDLDPEIFRRARWLFVEGYLLDVPSAAAAAMRAIALTRAAGGRVALTLSDPGLVDRHRATFWNLVGSADCLFGNVAEVTALMPGQPLFATLERIAARTGLVACTAGSRGAIIVDRDGMIEIAPAPLPGGRLVDATGAGDAFAGAFLHGLLSGTPLTRAGAHGALAAAEVIAAIGVRPRRALAPLLASGARAA